ncbi:MAG: sterol desaturase family protein [Pseudomonadota bacterium]
MDWLSSLLPNLNGTVAVNYLLSPVYILSTIVIACLVWLWQGKPGRVLSFLFPRHVYLHKSTLVDVKVAIFNTLFSATGAIGAFLFTPFVASTVVHYLTILSGAAPADTISVASGLFAALILFMTRDFCSYWNHFLHHDNRFLWPFHAVHHSAEVMTPLTILRSHPVYYVVQSLLISGLVGLVQALVVFGLVGYVPAWIFYVGAFGFKVFVFFGAHLRHSHVWLSYGPVLEHILISPAQHQIHHSSDPKHHDKNYGEVFAIWDWMFGTLYVPRGRETLTFGLADGEGNLLEQRHTGLRAVMIGPFVDLWQEITRKTSVTGSQDQAALPGEEGGPERSSS